MISGGIYVSLNSYSRDSILSSKVGIDLINKISQTLFVKSCFCNVLSPSAQLSSKAKLSSLKTKHSEKGIESCENNQWLKISTSHIYASTNCEIWGKIDNAIREMKMLYLKFENVISEFWKRNIRTLKTLYPNFENVISEHWKRYIQTLTLKTLHPNFETLYPN